MFTRLDPAIPLYVLEKGKGHAIGLIDYGQEHDLVWVTALDDSGEIWCAPNPRVRMLRNWTMGRPENPQITADRQSRDTATPCTDCLAREAAAEDSRPAG